MQEIFSALGGGAVLLTATRRLARELRREYAAWQRDRGLAVWQTPDVLPLDAFVTRLWGEWLTHGHTDAVLLSAAQQSLLWQRIISESRSAESLLNIQDTARQAQEAWRLIHEYRALLDGRYASTQDCEAFAGWAREFEEICSSRGWMDAARLPDFILDRLRVGEIPRPTPAWYAGFDQVSPRQRELLDALDAHSCGRAVRHSISRTRVCVSGEDEIRCAAAWARETLERDPAARVGVVALSLSQVRSKIDRIFGEELQPGASPSADAAFHISLGQPFHRYPMIHAALLALEFASGPVSVAQAGMLLRSPFLRGAAEELKARANLDARLRRESLWRVSSDELHRSAGSECAILRGGLTAFAAILNDTPATQPHTGWSRTFSSLLSALGWPGDRTLDSRDHQLLRRWTNLLSEFATLDAVAVPLTLADALHRLRGLASAAVFQFEDTGAPVQISDAEEAAGMLFDRLWIMGLHDEALPAPADPNPFLPLALQREHGLPGSSAERQFEAARITFERLCSSAADVVLSFPQMEADRTLAPSPFLTSTPMPVSAAPNRWVALMRSGVRLETIIDETGPPLEDDSLQRGGARVLGDMAACPFRAFAIYRLGARELDRAEPGLSPRDKGKALHDVLQRVWGELGSHEALRALTPEHLDTIIARHIASVLDRYPETTNTAVERVRLQRLLTRWMHLERQRSPFSVVAVEEKREIELEGLRLEIRADRVDELPGGGRVILDYKTGEVKSRCWIGDRPDEPQLPLYSITMQAPLAGAAFARVRADGVGFSGISETPFPGFTDFGKNGPPVAKQVEEWRRVLTSLAAQFRSGDARVDPKNGRKTCEYCAIFPLCRVLEHDID